MRVTVEELIRQYRQVSAARRRGIRAATAKSVHVSYELALAVASRETNMRNITGDGGHGRGIFQQDDRFQQTFLRMARGCKPPTSTPRYRSALPRGRVPMVGVGAARMVEIVEANIAAAKIAGVPMGFRTWTALAGYNAGMGNALRGWRLHRDPDRFTAGGDYGRDVLERRAALRLLA